MKNMQNNNGKKKKKSDPWARSGERPGRGHGSELFVLFGSSIVFCSLAKTSRKQKKTKKNKKFRPMGKVWVIHTQTKKQKKTKKQKTKKPKNQKNKKTKKTKKNKIAHPKGRGSDAECWVLSFCFFCFFLFFGFLVCVWIAIADVPNRDCQALSVVALEARSIHYSTAMSAMT